MPSPSAEVAPRRVLFFGDSLVAGVGDPTGGGWVARIVAECHARGQPITAYNLGVRGETSLQVTARLHAETVPRVPPSVEARLVVSFGANDTTCDNDAVRVAAERSHQALEQVLERATASGRPTYVVGPAPVDDTEQNRRIQALSTSFAEICRRHGTPFAPVVDRLLASEAWMSEVARGDGAHPGVRGYQALSDALIEDGLCAWLTDAV
jgi:acyl-CoA thioesterase-1